MDSERIQNRLRNVQSVEPLLGAMRTISLGAWQIALRHLGDLESLGREYQLILAALMPHLLKERIEKQEHLSNSLLKRTVIVATGSERGLCGRLDQDLIDFLQGEISARQTDISQLIVFGGRLGKAVARQILQPTRIHAASSTSMPSYSTLLQLTKDLLLEFSSGKIDQVLVFYTAYKGPSSRFPAVLKFLPFEVELKEKEDQMDWPTPILETDPVKLFFRVYEQIAAMRLYEVFLQTKAAIHSARYQLMEESTKNAERILEELEILLQMERRQGITREMQELAISAGLLER